MRTGWTPEDNYLVLDAGPIGTSHYHADKLGIVVHVGPRMVLHETSNYAYDNSPMQHYVRGTWAHNTVIVDEKIQRSYGMSQHYAAKAPLDNRWVTNAHFDFAEGTYDLGYVAADVPMSCVAHHREVLFVKPRFWIVVDHMAPCDEDEHDYRALFHMSPGAIKVDDEKKYATTLWKDGGFRIVPLVSCGITLSVVIGRTDPYYLGWVPAGSQQKKPSQVAVFNWKAKGPSTKVWLLAPKADNGEWSVDGFKLLEASGDGTVEVLLSTPSGEGRFRRLPAADHPAKGDITYIQLNRSGRQLNRIEIDG